MTWLVMGQPNMVLCALGILLTGCDFLAGSPVPVRPIMRLVSQEVANSEVAAAQERREVTTEPLIIEDEEGDLELGPEMSTLAPPQYIARIEHTDMSVEMQREAIGDAIWAIENLVDHRARYVQEEFERKFLDPKDEGAAWQCIISETGRDLDIYVIPRDTSYLEFSILKGPAFVDKSFYVLLFQSTSIKEDTGVEDE